MAMTSITVAPTAPPTIALVFDLLPPEDGAVDEDKEVDWFGTEVVDAEAVEEGLEAPIIAPGPISGLSKEHRCEDNEENLMKIRILTTGGHGFILIPIILQLAWNVSSESLREIYLETNCDVEGSPKSCRSRGRCHAPKKEIDP